MERPPVTDTNTGLCRLCDDDAGQENTCSDNHGSKKDADCRYCQGAEDCICREVKPVEVEHAFTKAGMGKAPFTFVGMVVRVGPIREYKNGQPTGLEIGAPGQPMGCCKHCGMGIKYCYVVKSADGFVNDVGSTCVNKTGDAGLKKVINKAAKEAKLERNIERIGRAMGALNDTLENQPHLGKAIREKLSEEPHPNDIWTDKTRLDYVMFLFDRGGTRGRLKAARFVEDAIKVLDFMKTGGK
jgi:hypothetical protein